MDGISPDDFKDVAELAWQRAASQCAGTAGYAQMSVERMRGVSQHLTIRDATSEPRGGRPTPGAKPATTEKPGVVGFNAPRKREGRGPRGGSTKYAPCAEAAILPEAEALRPWLGALQEEAKRMVPNAMSASA
jgi:hypothetical protein